MSNGATSGSSPARSVRGALLAQQVLECKTLLGRYLAGFSQVTVVRQTPDLPNHLAWCLGHLALTMHRLAEKVDGQAPPATDFVQVEGSDGTRGSREKGCFDAAGVAFGSRPIERHDYFPDLERSTAIYNAACDRLSALLASLDDAALDRPVAWGQAQYPLWAVATRMIFHNGFHTGQIADLRRALGFRSIMS
jgi:hypothetical protein